MQVLRRIWAENARSTPSEDPEWDRVFESIRNNLPDDDGYTPSKTAFDTTHRLLQLLRGKGFAPPTVVVPFDRGLIVEWQAGPASFEFEVRPTGNIFVWRFSESKECEYNKLESIASLAEVAT